MGWPSLYVVAVVVVVVVVVFIVVVFIVVFVVVLVVVVVSFVVVFVGDCGVGDTVWIKDPLARLLAQFTYLLAPHCSRTPLRSFVYSLAHSLPSSRERDLCLCIQCIDFTVSARSAKE